MSVLIATNVGARLAVDVGIDNSCDRIVSLGRHLGAPTSWTVNTGTITTLRDGANDLEFDVEVTGPFTGQVELSAPGARVIAACRALNLASGERVRVIFRVTRSHERDGSLAGAVPAVSTLKLATAQLIGRATLAADATSATVAGATLIGTATVVATGNKANSGASTMSGASMTFVLGTLSRLGSATMSASASVAASAQNENRAAAVLAGSGSMTSLSAVTRPGQAAMAGQGQVSAAANKVNSAAASMSGIATVSAVAVNQNQASSSMSASATVTASGDVF